MTLHFTGVFRRTRPILGEGELAAVCHEHGTIGNVQPETVHGFNACVTEARGHDDQVHGVFRTDSTYRAMLYPRRPAS